MNDETRIKFEFNCQPHPRFVEWLDRQPEELKAQVERRQKELAGHPDVMGNHRNADYARLTLLMRWCQAAFGYDYSA